MKHFLQTTKIFGFLSLLLMTMPSSFLFANPGKTKNSSRCAHGIDILPVRITSTMLDTSGTTPDARVVAVFKENPSDPGFVAKEFAVCKSVMNNPNRSVLFGLLAPSTTDGKVVNVHLCLEPKPCILAAERKEIKNFEPVQKTGKSKN